MRDGAVGIGRVAVELAEGHALEGVLLTDELAVVVLLRRDTFDVVGNALLVADETLNDPPVSESTSLFTAKTTDPFTVSSAWTSSCMSSFRQPVSRRRTRRAAPSVRVSGNASSSVPSPFRPGGAPGTPSLLQRPPPRCKASQVCAGVPRVLPRCVHVWVRRHAGPPDAGPHHLSPGGDDVTNDTLLGTDIRWVYCLPCRRAFELEDGHGARRCGRSDAVLLEDGILQVQGLVKALTPLETVVRLDGGEWTPSRGRDRAGPRPPPDPSRQFGSLRADLANLDRESCGRARSASGDRWMHRYSLHQVGDTHDDPIATTDPSRSGASPCEPPPDGTSGEGPRRPSGLTTTLAREQAVPPP